MWVCVDVGVGMYACGCACASVARGARCPTKTVNSPTMEPRTQGLTTNLLLRGENTWLECPISLSIGPFSFFLGLCLLL